MRNSNILVPTPSPLKRVRDPEPDHGVGRALQSRIDVLQRAPAHEANLAAPATLHAGTVLSSCIRHPPYAA